MGKQSQTPAVTNTTQTVQLPAWVDQASQANYAQAQQVSANLMKPYTGNTVAGQTAREGQSYGMVDASQNLAQPSMTTAKGTLGNLQGYQGQSVQAGSFPGADLSQYMNPYTQNVINAAQNTERQTLSNNLNQVGDAATQQGAYGGSRMAMQDGSAQAQSAMSMANLTSQLQNQNFMQAQSQINNDQNRALQAGTANQQNNLASAQLRGQSAMQGAQVGSASQQAGLQMAAAEQAAGMAQRQQAQDYLNQDYQRYQDQRQYPIDQLSILQYGLGVSPYGSTTTGQTTQTGGQQGGNTIGQVLGGIGSLFGLLSDENEKHSIIRLGHDPVTGTRVSAWKYLGESASAPHKISPTAQDLEKTMPHMVHTRPDGRKTVNAHAASRIAKSFLSAPSEPSNTVRGPAADKMMSSMESAFKAKPVRTDHKKKAPKPSFLGGL